MFTKISVNQTENPMFGYELFVEGVAVFSLDTTAVLTEEEKNLKFYSCVIIYFLRVAWNTPD
ncbi:MAG: hypothetical protein ACOYOV_15680 [Bacteroidales bacterium]